MLRWRGRPDSNSRSFMLHTGPTVGAVGRQQQRGDAVQRQVFAVRHSDRHLDVIRSDLAAERRLREPPRL